MASKLSFQTRKKKRAKDSSKPLKLNLKKWEKTVTLGPGRKVRLHV